MNQPAGKRRGPITLFCENLRFRRVVIAIAVLLPVLYLASTGPAVWMFQHSESETLHRALENVYAPIILLYETCPPFVPVWDWWVDIWEPD